MLETHPTEVLIHAVSRLSHRNGAPLSLPRSMITSTFIADIKDELASIEQLISVFLQRQTNLGSLVAFARATWYHRYTFGVRRTWSYWSISWLLHLGHSSQKVQEQTLTSPLQFPGWCKRSWTFLLFYSFSDSSDIALTAAAPGRWAYQC